MAVMTPRETWTDERLDELSNRMDREFREVRAEMRELRKELVKTREEIAELRSEVSGFEKRMDDKFDAVNRTLQIRFGLMGTMFVAVIGLIGTQL